MVEVIQSGTFKTWLMELRDRAAARRVAIRIERLAMGNPGDHKGVGEGVMELRLTYGPGYRVYYTHEGTTVVVLLAGGDKSTQAADIANAKAIMAERQAAKEQVEREREKGNG